MSNETERLKIDRKTALNVFGYGLYWDTYCYSVSAEHYEAIGQNFFAKACALFLIAIKASPQELESVVSEQLKLSIENSAASGDVNGEHNAQYLLTQVLPDFIQHLTEIMTNFDYDFTPESVILTH